jgi:hypothetical protein
MPENTPSLTQAPKPGAQTANQGAREERVSKRFREWRPVPAGATTEGQEHRRETLVPFPKRSRWQIPASQALPAALQDTEGRSQAPGVPTWEREGGLPGWAGSTMGVAQRNC